MLLDARLPRLPYCMVAMGRARPDELADRQPVRAVGALVTCAPPASPARCSCCRIPAAGAGAPTRSRSSTRAPATASSSWPGRPRRRPGGGTSERRPRVTVTLAAQTEAVGGAGADRRRARRGARRLPGAIPSHGHRADVEFVGLSAATRQRRQRQAERGAHDAVLLAVVRRGVALGRAAAPRAADVAQAHARRDGGLDAVAHRAPGAHVGRLFLGPDDLGQAGVARQQLGQLGRRERVELLDARDRDLVGAGALGVALDVVVEAAGAEHEPADVLAPLGAVGVVDDRLEACDR